MKISSIALDLIGNQKFCTIEEAISYAKDAEKIFQYDAWIRVFNRSDLSPFLAIETAISAGIIEIWKKVLVRSDVSIDLAFTYAASLRYIEVWSVVLMRPEVDYKKAIRIASSEKSVSLWKIALSKDGISPGEILKHTWYVNEDELGQHVLLKPEIVQYLTTLSTLELLEISKREEYFVLWNISLRRTDLSARDTLLYAKDSKDSNVMDIALCRSVVRDYVKSLKSKELLSLAKELNSINFWKIVLKKTQIAPRVALLCLKEIKNKEVAQIVLTREDVKRYLIRLPTKQIFDLGVSLYSWLGEVSFVKQSIFECLSILPKIEAISFAKNTAYIELAEAIITRSDLSLMDRVECAKSLNDICIWNVVVSYDEFTNYFAHLSDVEAEFFARECNAKPIWRKFLRRITISPETTIECAKLADDAISWSLIKSRQDVTDYLNS